MIWILLIYLLLITYYFPSQFVPYDSAFPSVEFLVLPLSVYNLAVYS